MNQRATPTWSGTVTSWDAATRAPLKAAATMVAALGGRLIRLATRVSRRPPLASSTG